MTPDEALEALACAAAYDRRTVGRMDALAWGKALDDVTLRDATDAIHLHYRDGREFLMPSDIRALVRVVRRQRVESVLGYATPTPPPPRELDDDPSAGVRWQQACIDAIASGRATSVPEAIVDADLVLGVVRQPEQLQQRPTAAITAQLASALRAPGTREHEQGQASA